jgi:hypothetical protein
MSPLAKAALLFVRAYKITFSPLFAGSCRYTPGCADYMSESITRYGFLRGGWIGTSGCAAVIPSAAMVTIPSRHRPVDHHDHKITNGTPRLLAITLSFLVLFLFQRFVMPPPAPFRLSTGRNVGGASRGSRRHPPCRTAPACTGTPHPLTRMRPRSPRP